MKQPLFAIFLATISFMVRGQGFTLLKDINPGSASSEVCYLTNINNTLFFVADDGTYGMELWKSHGTSASTVIVKDINVGAANSGIGYLTKANSLLFFVANDGNSGTELWKSDGTAEGTIMVKDIMPGSMGSNPSALASIGGVLYFAADDGTNGAELWRSDGTTSGTYMVKDINPFSASGFPQSLANVNGTLYFAANNGVKGMELWRSDGTASGTLLVKDIWNGASGSYPSEITDVNGTLFFSANNGSKGAELWKSDGTASGTVMLKDIWTGSSESYPYGFKNVNGTLFFSANNGTKGAELWKSDGTAIGTVLVKDVWPGTASGTVGNFSKIVNKLIFTGNDGVNGYKTWESDGSSSGTQILTGVGNPGNGDMQESIETDNNIYAGIRQSSLGTELWSISYTSILPLEFIDFKVTLVKESAIIDWETANEINTKEFMIERSIDGNDFSAIGKTEAANSAGTHAYQFTDINVTALQTRILYYRLRQVDVNGNFNYSKVVSVILNGSSRISLYPNPAINSINLSVSSSRKEKLGCIIFDNLGRVVMQDSRQLAAGTNQLSIEVDKLPAGVYYLKLNSHSIGERFQFVKQ